MGNEPTATDQNDFRNRIALEPCAVAYMAAPAVVQLCEVRTVDTLREHYYSRPIVCVKENTYTEDAQDEEGEQLVCMPILQHQSVPSVSIQSQVWSQSSDPPCRM